MCVHMHVCTHTHTHTHHIFLIHSSINGNLGYFHILANVNNAAMNTEVHIYFKIIVFVFCRLIRSSKISGSHSKNFYFSNNCIKAVKRNNIQKDICNRYKQQYITDSHYFQHCVL